MRKHTVTIYRVDTVNTYEFDLVSTARQFSKECATEAKASGADVTIFVSLKDESQYVWTQTFGWVESVNCCDNHPKQ